MENSAWKGYAMAEKKSADSSSLQDNSKKKKLNLTGLQKVWIAGALLFLGINLVLMCIFGLNTLLFTGNDHFLLREIVIAPPQGYMFSYWNNENYRDKRIAKICEDLQLIPGKTNLFSLDPGELRKIMTGKNPEIRNIEIRKNYPDQLVFSIQESSPYLNIGGGKCLDDQYRVVSMGRFKDLSLPLFLDPSEPRLKKVQPGDEYRTKTAEFALELTRHLQENFPRIRPVRIEHVEKDHTMKCLMEYEDHVFRVELPYPVKMDDLYKNKLPQLQDRLRTLHRKQEYSAVILLIYKDPVVKYKLPEKTTPDKKINR